MHWGCFSNNVMILCITDAGVYCTLRFCDTILTNTLYNASNIIYSLMHTFRCQKPVPRTYNVILEALDPQPDTQNVRSTPRSAKCIAKSAKSMRRHAKRTADGAKSTHRYEFCSSSRGVARNCRFVRCRQYVEV